MLLFVWIYVRWDTTNGLGKENVENLQNVNNNHHDIIVLNMLDGSVCVCVCVWNKHVV